MISLAIYSNYTFLGILLCLQVSLYQNPAILSSIIDTIVPFIVLFDRNLQFTSHIDQLAELEGRLFIGEQTSNIVITGLRRVGKTQLLLELAY